MTERTDRSLNGHANVLPAILTAIYAFKMEEQYTNSQDQDVRLGSWKLALRDERYCLQPPAKLSNWKRGKLITFPR